MSEMPPCPECGSAYTYEDRSAYVCPECGHEWDTASELVAEESHIVDANGKALSNGDTVTLIKDLKVKGIQLVDGDHDIDCKIPGVGAMQLKSEFVKKS